MKDGITIGQFCASEGVADWRVLSDGTYARYLTGSIARGAEFAARIALLPGFEGHHAAVDLRPDAATVRLISAADDWYGMSVRDVELARGISAVARELGLAADPAALQTLLVIPGALSVPAVFPFWRAVLGYVPRADSPAQDLVDPSGLGASFWLEHMREPRGDGRGAIHVAVWVPREEAEGRVAAALAAGGRMVRDDFAPSWWTLADAAGNEADIATTAGRD